MAKIYYTQTTLYLTIANNDEMSTPYEAKGYNHFEFNRLS